MFESQPRETVYILYFDNPSIFRVDCLQGWHYVPSAEKCVKHFDTSVTQVVANKSCKTFPGGALVKVVTREVFLEVLQIGER